MRFATTGLERTFYAPFGLTFIKGEEHAGRWDVFLEASNEGIDQEGEVLIRKALELSKDYFLEMGILSWDHKHKQTGQPQFIIGEPSEVAFTESPSRTLVKGWLYQKNKIAQQVWDNIQSDASKLGASVGGGILKKSADEKHPDIGVISRVIWDETALTHKPVNTGTFGHVSVIPFPEFAKALMAGSGTDAASYTGGRALTGESMDHLLTDQTFAQTDKEKITYQDSRKYMDGLLVAIAKGRVKSMNDVVSFTLDQGYSDGVASALIEFIAKKIPKLAGVR